MKLGNADFGMHIWRNWRISQGVSLSEVTEECAACFGIRARILPTTDDPVRTKLMTDKGPLDFQNRFVEERCQPAVREISLVRTEEAAASPQALAAIKDAEPHRLCSFQPAAIA